MEALALYRQMALRAEDTASALAAVNRRVEGHGLTLRPEEITALARRRAEVLQSTGRVEFGEGILPKLMFIFCDSPSIPPGEFAATLDALQECFYHFKNETGEKLSDDELLELMKAGFDGECQGSVEQLAGTVLERYADALRHGLPPEPPTAAHPAGQWWTDEGEEAGDDDA